MGTGKNQWAGARVNRPQPPTRGVNWSQGGQPPVHPAVQTLGVNPGMQSVLQDRLNSYTQPYQPQQPAQFAPGQQVAGWGTQPGADPRQYGAQIGGWTGDNASQQPTLGQQSTGYGQYGMNQPFTFSPMQAGGPGYGGSGYGFSGGYSGQGTGFMNTPGGMMEATGVDRNTGQPNWVPASSFMTTGTMQNYRPPQQGGGPNGSYTTGYGTGGGGGQSWVNQPMAGGNMRQQPMNQQPYQSPFQRAPQQYAQNYMGGGSNLYGTGGIGGNQTYQDAYAAATGNINPNDPRYSQRGAASPDMSRQISQITQQNNAALGISPEQYARQSAWNQQHPM